MKQIINFVFILTFVLIFTSCGINIINKDKDTILSKQEKELSSIKEEIKEHNYLNAIKLTEKYISKYPLDIEGYQTLIRILDLNDNNKLDYKSYQEKYKNYIQNKNLPDSIETQMDFCFERAINDSINKKHLQKIISKYPNSTITQQLSREEIYDLAIMRDDSLRAYKLKEYLNKFPHNKWSLLAWNYLIYSFHNLHNNIQVDSLLNFLEEEYSHNHKYVNLLANWNVRRNKNLGKYEKKMNRVIKNIKDSSQNEYFDIWQMKSKSELIDKYRFTYAQILFKNEKYENAIEALNEINIKDFKAKEFYLMGHSELEMDNKGKAFTNLLKSVKLGDERNYWSVKSDSLLRLIYQDFSDNSNNFIEFLRVWDNYKGTTFTDVTDEAGLKHYKQRRIAWGDYNNDGWDDILLSGNTLLKNNKDGTFTDVSDIAGIKEGKTNGGIWADFDRDGFLDFFATSSSNIEEDVLWKNLGNGKFLNVTLDTPLADTLQTEGAAWGDINGDLYPDIYLANYERWQVMANEPDFLFLNKKDGFFKDVTLPLQIVPIFNENQAGRGVNWGDYNNDGYLDIFVSNYRLDKNFLWKNVRGKYFKNVSEKTGVEGNYVDGWYGHTIGSEWGDFDNDGDLDLISANLAHPRYIQFSDMTMLLENLIKESRFIDIRDSAGITYDECHSDPSWGDVNTDGYLDLFITSVYPNRRSYLYLNNGNKTFKDITYLAGVRTFNSWGAAYSDYDNDGDLDLLVCSGDGVKLFNNDSSTKNWLEIKILDKNGNTPIIGTRVEVKQNKLKQIREVQGGKGTTNQHSQTLYFGFPANDAVDIEVKYLDGKVKKLKNQKIHQCIKIIYN